MSYKNDTDDLNIFLGCLAVGVVVTLLSGLGYAMWHNHNNPIANEVETAAVIQKYGCKRTGEFVGKYAEAVYQCDDSGKYKYSELEHLATAEKRDKK